MAKVLAWYLENNNDIPPDHLCEDKKLYGKCLYWFEPPIPLVHNPLVVEEYHGDMWTMRIEALPR